MKSFLKASPCLKQTSTPAILVHSSATVEESSLKPLLGYLNGFWEQIRRERLCGLIRARRVALCLMAGMLRSRTWRYLAKLVEYGKSPSKQLRSCKCSAFLMIYLCLVVSKTVVNGLNTKRRIVLKHLDSAFCRSIRKIAFLMWAYKCFKIAVLSYPEKIV